MVPRDESGSSSQTPLGSRLGKFFQDAFTLVDSGPAARQEVMQRLGGLGLQRVTELCDRILDLPVSAAQVLLLEVLPFLKILAHPAVINSPSLEAPSQRIFSFIGHNTVRFHDIFDLFVERLSETSIVGVLPDEAIRTTQSDLIRVPIVVLSRLLDFSVDASTSDRMKGVASRLAGLFASGDELDEALRAELVRHLRRIDRRLRLDLHLEGPRAPVARSEGPRFICSQERPGGRHDNDHDDICKIEILPTAAETRCTRSEYLPTVDPDSWHTPRDNTLAGLLDRQFRLLREDSVGPLREAVRQVLEELNRSRDVAVLVRDNNKHNNNNVRITRYDKVQVVRIEADAFARGAAFEVSFDGPSQLRREKSLSVQERLAWWAGSRRLGVDALVCLVDPDGEGDLLFCTVLRKTRAQDRTLSEHERSDSAIEAAEGNRYRVRLGAAALSEHSTRFVFKNFPRTRLGHQYTLVEFPGVLLPSFEPVLRALQQKSRMDELPLAELLTPPAQTTALTSTGLPAYARRSGFTYNMAALLNGRAYAWDPRQPFDHSLLEVHSTLDEAQGRAVVAALSNQVALVQGPPGTGKSYCGVGLVRVLLASKSARSPLGPIIVVCYTNHALDQMLEHLLTAGVTQMIRIGTRSKSQTVAPLNLNRIVKTQGFRTRAEKSEVWRLHQSMKDSQRQLECTAEQIELTGLWGSVKDRAEACFPGVTALIEQRGDADGFVEVSRPGKTEKQRFAQWLRGEDRATARQRQVLFESWVGERKDPLVQRYHRLSKRLAEDQGRLDKLRMEEQLRCLEQADIVGVTSSGLARHSELFHHLRSKVVLIEEAGELLESHTLVSLLPSVEHAILIGDHLQLRPQIANFELGRESTRGARYSLDVSLFERLVAPAEDVRAVRLPFSQLRTQRRMHPSVSNLIRELYPALEDFPTVAEYPPVSGIKKRLYWIDHAHLEAGADEEQSTSRRNEHEAEMTVALVSHLIKQGAYRGPEGIAVLTPYLGQLQHLRRRMQSQFEIVVSERDEDDLAEHGLTEGDGGKPARSAPHKSTMLQAVRLATVDNFQGEEASVVVVSLVRSNAKGQVGFLKTSNRINVLLSRAKHGLYILGNSETARTVPFWARTIDRLQQAQCIGPSLELVCPRHAEATIAVTKPSDFAMFSPEGGCQRACAQRLTCGHVCRRSCHADQLHAAVECLERCPRLLSCGHPCLKRCSQACEKQCQVAIDMAADFVLPCGHHVDELECRYVRGGAAYSCQIIVPRTPRICGHTLQLPCHVDVTSDDFQCPALCGEILPCGHTCNRPCRDCRTEAGPPSHGTCSTICGRRYTSCAHSCRQACHGSQPCEPCPARCENRCEHSQCVRQCHEPCAPCLEETCGVSCKHYACPLPCAVPCSHVPCSRRCEQLLSCGHQCPSLCSEPCPEQRYCAICADDKTKDAIVDFLIGESYGETDLDRDPIVVPLCGHLITVSNLDGHMDMRAHYEYAAGDVIVGLAGVDKPFSSGEMKGCPTCRGTLTSIRRYSRVTRRAALDATTKRFVSWANTQLVRLVRMFHEEHDQLIRKADVLSSERAPKAEVASYFARPLNLGGGLSEQAGALRRLKAKRHARMIDLHVAIAEYRNDVQAKEQPFRRVFELVEQLRARGSGLETFRFDEAIITNNFEIKATALLHRCTIALLRDLLMMQEKATGSQRLHATFRLEHNIQECTDLVDTAWRAKLPRQTAEGHISVALYQRIMFGEDEQDRLSTLKATALHHLDQADEVIKAYPGSTAGLGEEVESARTYVNGGVFYQTVTSAEMRQVYAAMGQEFTGTGQVDSQFWLCERH